MAITSQVPKFHCFNADHQRVNSPSHHNFRSGPIKSLEEAQAFAIGFNASHGGSRYWTITNVGDHEDFAHASSMEVINPARVEPLKFPNFRVFFEDDYKLMADGFPAAPNWCRNDPKFQWELKEVPGGHAMVSADRELVVNIIWSSGQGGSTRFFIIRSQPDMTISMVAPVYPELGIMSEGKFKGMQVRTDLFPAVLTDILGKLLY